MGLPGARLRQLNGLRSSENEVRLPIMHSFRRGARNGIGFGGAVIGAMLLAACGQAPASAPLGAKAPPAVSVSAETPHRATIQQLLTLNGEVRASQQISVLPKGSGRVQQILVNTGSL